MNNATATVTVSPEAKVEFLMLVNLAMGLAVGQSLEIRDTTYCSYITFKDTPSKVLFFSELHVQWYNKDLKPAPIEMESSKVQVPNVDGDNFVKWIEEFISKDTTQELTDSVGDFWQTFYFTGSPENCEKFNALHTSFMESLEVNN